MTQNKAFRSITACIIAMLLVVLAVPFGVFANAPDDATVAAETTSDAAETTAPSSDNKTEEKNEPEENKLGVGFWVSMGILGVLIIVGVVFAIIKREKLKLWFKSYKSEIKKIVWMPWTQVKKNTLVVIVVVVVLAALIGLLDAAFFKGINKLGELF